jgi:hypothetical protein
LQIPVDLEGEMRRAMMLTASLTDILNGEEAFLFSLSVHLLKG